MVRSDAKWDSPLTQKYQLLLVISLFSLSDEKPLCEGQKKVSLPHSLFASKIIQFIHNQPSVSHSITAAQSPRSAMQDWITSHGPQELTIASVGWYQPQVWTQAFPFLRCIATSLTFVFSFLDGSYFSFLLTKQCTSMAASEINSSLVPSSFSHFGKYSWLTEKCVVEAKYAQKIHFGIW